MFQSSSENIAAGESTGAQEATATSANRFPKQQSLLTLSGIGLALGSLKSALRQIRRGISPFKFFKIPRTPKYLRHNYIRYPAIALLFLLAARRVRAAIG